MKLILLFSFFFLSSGAHSQSNSVNSLPPGRYETIIKNSEDKWDGGDIILLDDSRYRISSGGEVGEYKFSATAQRIFFVSGPLKTVFAKTVLNAQRPSIVIPAAENEQLGLNITSADVVASLRK